MICLVPVHCTTRIRGQTVLGVGCSAGESLDLFVALCLVLPVAVVLLLVVQSPVVMLLLVVQPLVAVLLLVVQPLVAVSLLVVQPLALMPLPVSVDSVL